MNRRTIIINESEASLANFNRHFSNSEIMDFWNNNRGRIEGRGTVAIRTAFNRNWDNGQLIRNETNAEVTANRRQVLRSVRAVWRP